MKDCIFCKIIRGEIPANKVYEDDEILAFHDTRPAAPVHTLVIPKKHIPSLMHFEAEDLELAGRLFYKAQELAKEPGRLCPEGLGESGARFVVNAGKHAGQTVDHIHIHILGGRRLSWPPG